MTSWKNSYLKQEKNPRSFFWLQKMGVPRTSMKYYDRHGRVFRMSPTSCTKYKGVYMLALEHQCWYVGHTENFPARMRQHFSEEGGSQWTRKHKPTRVVAFWGHKDKEFENQKTLELMDRFGHNNVRGGVWTLSMDYEHPPQSL
jgi:hypothetical protein